MTLLTYLAFTMLFAILSLVAFVAMTIAKAVAARPELADVDPLALRLTRQLSGFCFFFCMACTMALAGFGLAYGALLLIGVVQ
jgi:hypothetical protein